MNPLIAIANELISKRGAQVVIYNKAEFRKKVESIGAKFVENVHFSEEDGQETDGNDLYEVFRLMNKFIDMTSNSFKDMIKMVEEEKPDLILYDQIFVPGRILVDYLHHKYKKNNFKKEFRPPAHLSISTTFVFNQDDIVKSQKMYKWYHIIWVSILIIINLIKQIILKFKYEITLRPSLKDLLFPQNEPVMLTVLSELQRSAHLLENVKLIGACISGESRVKSEVYESADELSQIIAKYEPVNPLPLKDYFLPNNYTSPNDKSKLVYISLGTIFNKNPLLFENIFECIHILNKDEVNKFDFIASLGDNMFKHFNEKIKKGN
jgi:UDP:flavonoid glycosyltransferase YjiC (YdhE family)